MGRFKYTCGDGPLTEEQRQFYEDNGYIVIRNNVSSDLLDELRQRFVDICEGVVDPGMAVLMEDLSLKHKGVKGEYLINKIQDWLYDDVFFKYATNKTVVDVVSNIIGPNITAYHSMLINKPPNAHPGSSLHPMHQGFRKKLYHEVEGMDHLPKLHIAMEKGDTVFSHPLLLHGSGPNYSKRFRKAISCHYADSNCDFVNVKEASQKDAVREVEDLFVKKGMSFKIYDIMKLKSRLVAGVPGNFQRLDSSL